MTRRLALIAFGTLSVIALGLLGWWALTGLRAERGAEVVPTSPAAAAPEAPTAEPERLIEVELFFPGSDGLLHVERREIVEKPAGAERAVAAVAALLGGPTTPGLVAPFPPEVTVARADLGASGVLYLGLEGPPAPPAAGSLIETLRVWSLVDTALAAVPEARAVALAWNGTQPESLGGHLDTARPLRARTDLVRSGE